MDRPSSTLRLDRPAPDGVPFPSCSILRTTTRREPPGHPRPRRKKNPWRYAAGRFPRRSPRPPCSTEQEAAEQEKRRERRRSRRRAGGRRQAPGRRRRVVSDKMEGKRRKCTMPSTISNCSDRAPLLHVGVGMKSARSPSGSSRWKSRLRFHDRKPRGYVERSRRNLATAGQAFQERSEVTAWDLKNCLPHDGSRKSPASDEEKPRRPESANENLFRIASQRDLLLDPHRKFHTGEQPAGGTSAAWDESPPAPAAWNAGVKPIERRASSSLAKLRRFFRQHQNVGIIPVSTALSTGNRETSDLQFQTRDSLISTFAIEAGWHRFRTTTRA